MMNHFVTDYKQTKVLCSVDEKYEEKLEDLESY
jgi:hypothetical protein